MEVSSDSANDALPQFRIASLPPDFYYIPDFISAEEEASILQKARLFFLSRLMGSCPSIPAQRWITLSHRRLQAHPSTLTKNNSLLAAPLPSYLLTPVVDRFKTIGIFNHTPHRGPNHVLINEYKRGEGIMPHEDGNAYADVVATVSLGAPICLEITLKPPSGADGDNQTVFEAPDSREQGTHGSDMKESDVGHDDDTAEGKSSSLPYRVPTRILQEPRSLLITTGSAYQSVLHGISSIEVDQNLNAETVANWHLLAEPHAFEEAGGRNERATRVSLTYRDVLKVSSAASKVLGALRKR